VIKISEPELNKKVKKKISLAKQKSELIKEKTAGNKRKV
jgi:hypothetical protein